MPSIRRTGAALLAALLLAACGKQAPPAGGAAPRLVSSVPADGAKIGDRQQPLTLVFSTAIERSSLTLTADPPVDLAQVAWPQPTRAVATPGGGWPAGAAVTVTIGGKDAQGRPLPAGTRVTFTVAASQADENGPPATPSGVTAVAGDGGFRLSWEANDEPDLAGYQLVWGPEGGEAEGAQFVPAPTTEAEVTGLENGRAYRYRLQAEDASGNRSAPAEGTVTPRDATPPTLVSSVPADGATGLGLVPQVSFTFSEPIDEGSFAFEACLLDELGGGCTGPASLGPDVAWSQGGRVAALDAELPPGASVRVSLAATDLAGNPLTGATTVEFALAPVEDVSPPDVVGFSHSVNPATHRLSLELRFSEAMDQASFAAAVAVVPGVTCTWQWPEPHRAVCQNSLAQQLTTYTVGVSTAAKDLAGNALEVPYVNSVTTTDFPPRLVSVTPAIGAMNVSQTTPIAFRFSEPLQTGSLSLSVTVGEAAVAGAAVWDVDEAGFTFYPSTGYPAGAIVAWSVTALRDQAGNPIPAPLTGSFMTRPVIGPGPAGGSR